MLQKFGVSYYYALPVVQDHETCWMMDLIVVLISLCLFHSISIASSTGSRNLLDDGSDCCSDLTMFVS